jgi:ABC transporter with metal-binding/Fe-S-binding domain ATP-binding protein
MKIGVLFSGGKDSTYAAWLAKKSGHELACLITLFSENEESYMFHTPAIKLTEKQAKLMGLPLITRETKGEKEKELKDLKRAIEKAKVKYNIKGIVTGALASNYQAERIQKICEELDLKCLNPLWHKDQLEYLKELVENRFEVIITAVGAYRFDKKWIGRRIDNNFIEEIKVLANRFAINPAGEGGEFESLVVNCPLFRKKLGFKLIDILGEGNSWRGILE